MTLFLALFLAFVCAVGTPALAQTEGGKPGSPTIGTIKIEIREIFDDPDVGIGYRLANNLKASTREHIVRRELLFKEGDRFDPFLLEESERNLRSLPFLRRVTITPFPRGDAVDLLVSVQDTWTLIPFASLTSGGGTERKTIGVADSNLLGYGKRLEFLVADDEGREKAEVLWDDRRFLGSYQQLTLGLFHRSDGYRTVGAYGLPFRSLVDKSSWSLNTDIFDLVGKLYKAGDERFIFRQKQENVSAGYTFARGNPEELVRRYTIGYDYQSDTFELPDEDDFEDADVDPDDVEQDLGQLAEDRRFSGPFIGFQQIEPDFISLNYVDRFERVEDFNLGNEIIARLTAAADAFGSHENTLIYSLSHSDGTRFGATSFLRGRFGLSTRATDEGFENTVFSCDFRYYNVMGPRYIKDRYVGRHTLAAALTVEHSEDLDRDREFLLGASNGLRGYEDRTFTGEQRVLLNLEERAHFIEDFLRLFSIGTAVFLDVGGTSRTGVGDALTDELHGDVGIGLRIGAPRASGGNVLRLDMAFPLRSGEDGSDAFEPRFLISTSQVVSARLPVESTQTGGSNVNLRILP